MTTKRSTPALRHWKLGGASGAALLVAAVLGATLLVVYAFSNTPSPSVKTPKTLAPTHSTDDLLPDLHDASEGFAIAVEEFNPAPLTDLSAPTPAELNEQQPNQPDLDAQTPSPRAVTLTAATPTNSTPTAAAPPKPTHRWITVTVKRGDSLWRIFQRHGLNPKDAYAVARLKDAAILSKIRPRQKIQLAIDEKGALAGLRYGLNTFSTLHVTRARGSDNAARFIAKVITRTPEVRLRGEKATIWTSLLGAVQEADIDFEIVYELAQIFDWQVDFTRDIRRGDQFAVLFEEIFLDGKKVGNGDILAAELITSKKIRRAIRHIDARGGITYYAPNGAGIQRSFLRSPVKFRRITSQFSSKRYHPILKKWRAHRGVDYGAAKGTPVRATSDGVVTLAKRNHGYGKTVIIAHGSKYQTLYAHLHHFANRAKPRARVKQGEIIGYVGRTGWATGPHLHYEFRVRGVHRNPLTVTFPRSASIPAKYKSAFVKQARAWIAKLGKIRPDRLAQNDPAQ